MDSFMFISIVILALTEMVKSLLPSVRGWLTIAIALLVGVVVSLFGGYLGLPDISLADGIVSALGAVGISTAAKKAAPTNSKVE